MRPQTLIDLTRELIARVLRFDAPADAVVAQYFRAQPKLGQHDRQRLGDAVYALLRRKTLFEHWAHNGRGAPDRRLALLALSDEREFLAPALSAEEARWLAACTATLASPLPDEAVHNLPSWLAQALMAQCGDEQFHALAHALLQPAPLDLRVNVLRCKRVQAEQALASVGIATEPTPYSLWGLRVQGKPDLRGLPLFRRGAIEVQDEGSQLLALLLGARRGELVCDFCAGAGGKTLAIGAAMRSSGRLYAFDVSAQRLAELKQRAARGGLTHVYPAAIAPEVDERLARLAGKLDRVLVDAPCSGLGTLRRHPDLKWRQTPAAVAEFAVQQRSILERAARLLKAGGTLVYATCSLLTDENEAVAQAFTEGHASFKPVAVSGLLGAQKIPQADALCGADGRYLRLWPHRHQTDGFFAAAWQRSH